MPMIPALDVVWASEGRTLKLSDAFSEAMFTTTPVLGRGVTSIQLYWDGTRWWIASATWDDERPDNPIPAELR